MDEKDVARFFDYFETPDPNAIRLIARWANRLTLPGAPSVGPRAEGNRQENSQAIENTGEMWGRSLYPRRLGDVGGSLKRTGLW